MKALLWLGHCPAQYADSSVRFGLLHILKNMTTSTADLEQEYNQEVEQLRELAQRGLPGAGEL